jgi:hypothetical protein
MFDMEVDNTLTLSNHQELIKELESYDWNYQQKISKDSWKN